MADDIIRPHNAAAAEKARADAAKQQAEAKAQEERMMQAYADYLEDLKAKDPAEYKQVVDDLMAAAHRLKEFAKAFVLP